MDGFLAWLRAQARLLVGVAVFTAVEIVTLVQWLAAALAMEAGRAAGVLFGGLFVEHVIQGVVKRGQSVFSLANLLAMVRERGKLIAVFTVVETVIWIAARFVEGAVGAPLLETGEKAALSAFTFFFLFGTLAAKHALAENAFERNIFSFDGVLRGRNLLASAIEAAGGAIWLAAPSVQTVVIMTVTQYVEHYLLSRGR